MVHIEGTEICTQCGQTGIKDLKAHTQNVHEKIPCAYCAKLIGIVIQRWSFLRRSTQWFSALNFTGLYQKPGLHIW